MLLICLYLLIIFINCERSKIGLSIMKCSRRPLSSRKERVCKEIEKAEVCAILKFNQKRKNSTMQSINNYFKKIHDIRRKQGRRYELNSIMSLVLLGYMAGCTSLAKIYRFSKGLNKKTRLRLGFSGGTTPSHPTITII